MAEEKGKEKKSSLSLGKVLLIIIIISMAFILMQKNGITMTKVEEKSEMNDNPHKGY